MVKSSDEYYETLKGLIVKEEILLLTHKRFKGARQSYVYARCGMSQKYFEKAYKKGDVILQFGEIGPRVGYPIEWEEALMDYIRDNS